MTHSSKTTSLL